jgi:hypothetical protein
MYSGYLASNLGKIVGIAKKWGCYALLSLLYFHPIFNKPNATSRTHIAFLRGQNPAIKT